MRTKTVDEALAIENANPYGNAASVFTQNGAWPVSSTGQAPA